MCHIIPKYIIYKVIYIICIYIYLYTIRPFLITSTAVTLAREPSSFTCITAIPNWCFYFYLCPLKTCHIIS